MSTCSLFKCKIFFSFILIGFLSCGGGSDDDSAPMVNAPSNLVISANIFGATASNPNGDGTGVVTFNFTATNATSYKINLGNGEVVETTATTLKYTYTGAGINTYKVFVSAYKGDKYVSSEISITVKINSGLLWSDEFNYTGSPDPAKWGYDIGRGNNGWGNGEAQYYTNRTDNVKVEDGLLKITAKKESYEGANYTSARILTEGKLDFKYGKVEVRAKLPIGKGTWPAIWMLGSSIRTVGWPACGEIDIMEHVGNNQGTVQSAMHTPSSYGGTINHGSQFLNDVSTAFHVYSVEWTVEQMIFAVDGVVHYKYNPSTKNSNTWPFDAKQFIILNVAMGGGFGGAIDPNFSQSTMEIDYVRVYQ